MELPKRKLLVLLVWLGVMCHAPPVHGCWRSVFSSGSDVEYYDPSTDTPASEIIIPSDDKVWLFAVDGIKKPYNFMDNNGSLTGFDVDLVAKVCQVANKRCEMVLSEFTECTFSSRNLSLAGRGLMSGWFDGCPSYVDSIDRRGAFDFTSPYLSTSSSFTVAPGNPSGFDPTLTDFSKFKIIHLDGAVTNAQCLNRLGKKFGEIFIAKSLPDAKAKLLNKQADVLFSPRTQISGLEVLPARVHCEKGGVGIMAKKGSELSSWWNPAFSSFVSSGQYAQFCSESSAKYNENIWCLFNFNEKVMTETPGKTWLFSVSGRRKPFNFLDETGHLVGHDVDFVNAVCQIASQKCEMVLTEFTECGFTDQNINFAGRGILDGWFDACTGYADSVDRRNNFDFTRAYLKSSSTFTVAPGNPSGFHPDQSVYSNFTFTHLTGAYTNAACLNRLKKKFKKIIIAANLPDAKRILSNREADVLFSPRTHIPGLETFPQRFHCEKTGTAMFTRKGSALVSWWNKAFQTFVETGQYKQQCEESSRKYNYTINCFMPNELIRMWDPFYGNDVIVG